jgi:hypothetical protein
MPETSQRHRFWNADAGQQPVPRRRCGRMHIHINHNQASWPASNLDPETSLHSPPVTYPNRFRSRGVKSVAPSPGRYTWTVASRMTLFLTTTAVGRRSHSTWREREHRPVLSHAPQGRPQPALRGRTAGHCAPLESLRENRSSEATSSPMSDRSYSKPESFCTGQASRLRRPHNPTAHGTELYFNETAPGTKRMK